MDTSYSCEDVCEAPAKPIGENGGDFELLLFDGCNYRSLLFSNPLFRGLFHF